jgi:hypothetical protein
LSVGRFPFASMMGCSCVRSLFRQAIASVIWNFEDSATRGPVNALSGPDSTR